MAKKQLYVDTHIFQDLPPNCINRDDTGSPKSCLYGGVTRARVSSQAWKRAIRKSFMESIPEETGIRTKKVARLIQEKILELSPELSEKEAEKMAMDAFKKIGFSKAKDLDIGVDTLLLVSRQQIEEIARLALAKESKAKVYKEAFMKAPSDDQMLFGRMVASDQDLNFDACCQVAHAISTHGIQTEYDYFTAVDDLGDNAGAGHIGITEFNSSTLYRYATVNVLDLYRYAGLKAADITAQFVKAFIFSMPDGKENAFAHRTLPSLVYVTVRTDQPVNLVSAFEKPVQSSGNGYTEESVSRLKAEARRAYDLFVEEPFKAYAIGANMEDLADSVKAAELISDLSSVLKKELEAER